MIAACIVAALVCVPQVPSPPATIEDCLRYRRCAFNMNLGKNVDLVLRGKVEETLPGGLGFLPQTQGKINLSIRWRF